MLPCVDDVFFLIFLIRLSCVTGTVDGDLWEIGCGRGSTPLLRAIAREGRRQLVSVENDPAWLAALKSNLPPTPYHRYVAIEGDGWRRFFETLTHPPGSHSIDLRAFRTLSALCLFLFFSFFFFLKKYI